MKVFTEEQKFRQWYFLAIIAIVFSVIIYTTVTEFREIGDDTRQLSVLIITTILTLMILFLVLFLSLRTKINERGIYYGFWPFQLKLKHLAWNEIDRIYVRKYNPIREYGGWGYRFSFGKDGKAYNVSGSTGIQIIFKNGKKTLIGTQKKTEVERVLNTYKHLL